MTLEQFHAALRKKWPGVKLDPDQYKVWVGDLGLTWPGPDDHIRAEMCCHEALGHGVTINAAIKELRQMLHLEIQEAREALKALKEATCKKP